MTIGETTDGHDAVEDLELLRSTVEIWIERAAAAVLDFRLDDGSFLRDSKPSAHEKAHLTTTARCYIALLYANRALKPNSDHGAAEWAPGFREFVSSRHMTWTIDGDTVRFRELTKEDAKDADEVNTFDVAHLADHIQVAAYLKRFDIPGSDDAPFAFAGPAVAAAGDAADVGPSPPVAGTASGLSDLREAVVMHLGEAIGNATTAGKDGARHTGEVVFDRDKTDSAHYFATLHALRALHVLGAAPPPALTRIVEGARAFALEQCYYFQRGTTHRQDPIRLAFAGCIYALYDEHVDKELCLAIVEALAQAQQRNGSWPATHPIFRTNERPWHIASHEVALCLTWLYFQPKLPDAARPLLIAMLRRYFADAVIPTFGRSPSRQAGGPAKPRSGWQDDHTVGAETTVGWASAIICHFLSNFRLVLDDWINRRVIEDLGLAMTTQGYLIDDVHGHPAVRWQRSYPGGKLYLRGRRPEEEDAPLAGDVDEAVADEPRAAEPADHPREDPPAGEEERSQTSAHEAQRGVEGPAPTVEDDARAATTPTTNDGPPDESEAPRPSTAPGATGHAGVVWPDLPPHGWTVLPPRVEDLAEEIYTNWTDPLDKNAISTWLAENMLLPVYRSPDERPDATGCAGLLPGSPGTRKTSLVRQIAHAIDWPMVAVPASLIFARGFDMMEAQASLVFRRLNLLRRCVIFFDEFEEFFVSRTSREGELADTNYRQRTIAAFTTSAMLPRMQDLHDQRRCLIFLATNHLDKMDSAIRRRGRFDVRIMVDHPSVARLKEYLGTMPQQALARVRLAEDAHVRDQTRKAAEKALDVVAETATDVEVRFSYLEDILRMRPGPGETDESYTSRMSNALLRKVNDKSPDDPPIVTAKGP